MKKKITVLIVEDSALMRRELRQIIDSDPDLQVIGTAQDGREGLEKTKALNPDVVTIDINLPVMDGITCLQYIMIEAPRPCLIISAYTKNDSIETFEALELGAADFVEKPSGEVSRDIKKLSEEITRKIKEAANVNLSVISRYKPVTVDKKPLRQSPNQNLPDKVVVIGVSTGGPRTLMQIIPALPPNLNAPVLVIQHMPGRFTKAFAERVNSHSIIEVREAQNKEILQNGVVYVAPGEYNLYLYTYLENVFIGLSKPTGDDIITPSVEKAMESAIGIFGKQTIGVILTGMGNDGVNAMTRLYELDGETIAESEETAIVYGMPREVILKGVAKVVAPAYEIAKKIEEAVKKLNTTKNPNDTH